MKKKFFLLPCIAAVAIATFVGAKTFKSNAEESNDLLMANVEAMSQEEGSGNYIICYHESKVRKGWTYYKCGSCSQIYDEKGKGTYSKCFR